MVIGHEELQVNKGRYTAIIGDDELHVTGNVKITVTGNASIDVTEKAKIKSAVSIDLSAPEVKLNAGTLKLNS